MLFVLPAVIRRSPRTSAIQVAVGPVRLERIVFVHEHDSERHVVIGLVLQGDVGYDNAYVSLAGIFLGDGGSKAEIRIQRHPKSHVCV